VRPVGFRVNRQQIALFEMLAFFAAACLLVCLDRYASAMTFCVNVSLRNAMKLHLVIIVGFVFSLAIGCGGREDFSAPPANLANIRAKSKPKSETAKQPENPAVPAAKTIAQDAVSPATAAVGDSNDTVDTESVNKEDPHSLTAPAKPPPSVVEGAPGAVGGGPDETKDSLNSEMPSVSDTAAADVVTAGGKTTAQIAADKEKKRSVASAGMSLLDKLKTDGGAADKKKEPGQATAARRVVSRTGRFAIAVKTWFQLRNHLAKRFYVAATSDGARIAASSGERSLGVLSTHVVVLGEEFSWERRESTVAAVVCGKKEITTQAVNGLPGILTAIEIIQNGDVVLVGTSDGRLIARSSANLQDWDIYAQDLFSWQDEHRPATRVSETAIRVVRAISSDRLLTVDDSGNCRIWKTSDVVHRPVNPMEVSEEQAKLPEAPVLATAPLCSVEIPHARVLGVFFSKSGNHGALITSDEQVTVFQTHDGSVVDAVTASQLDDTQPVACIIEEDQMRVLVGLADGRILRRSLKGGDAVTSTHDDGLEVDFEAIFVPDTSDRFGAVTSMDVSPDGVTLCFGRYSGVVCCFDLPRKQLLRADSLHQGPVIELRCTEAGVFTIDDQRVAKLSNLPGVPRPATAAETFRLPTDLVLKETELIEPDEELKQDKFTIRRNYDGDVTDASAAALNRAGIRSADPILALFEHQLRVAASDEVRAGIRQKIRIQKLKSDVEPDRSYGSDSPLRLAELASEFDFQSRPLRRVVMSLSDDGMTLAAAQYYRTSLIRGAAPDQPVSVWDTTTETRLRTWKSSKGVFRLDLDVDAGLVLPSPLSGRMKLFSGRFLAENYPVLASQRSPLDDRLAAGMTGRPGTALEIVALFGADKEEVKAGVEAFEGVVPAIAWSADGSSLFVSVRERSQSRLLELDGTSLSILSEISAEPMTGSWDVDKLDLLRGTLGATSILPSPGGKLVVTYGKHSTTPSPYQLRIWKRTGDHWPQDQRVVVESKEDLVEQEMTDTQMVFVNQQDSMLAVVGTKGVGVVNTRTGEIDQRLELPNVGDRRPVTVLSPDGKWLMAGDREGNVWVWSLRALKRKPLQFAAQAGPVIGLAMSANSEFLATAGEENRIRVWKMTEFLSSDVKAASR